MKLYLGADHAGYELKEKVKPKLTRKYEVVDCGAKKYDAKDDYPDYAKAVGKKMAKKGFGVLFCGSAEGMCIAANKMKGIRAIASTDEKMVKQARQHNDANVLCLPGGGMRRKVKGIGISAQKALRLIEVFVNASFSNAIRHQRRLRKIKAMER